MTWQRRHCVECWHDMEHCATCGCHEPEPVATQANRTPARYDEDISETAPAEVLVTPQPGPNRDSTPDLTRRIRG